MLGEGPASASDHGSGTQQSLWAPGDFGHFDLLSRIAGGGMAEVFLARCIHDFSSAAGSYVVVKRILPRLAGRPDLVALFEQEARILERLHHPNIIRFLECGRSEGLPYIAMERVRQ